MLRDRQTTEQALLALGELLEARGEAFAIAIIGGSALNMLQIVERVTQDVDILAFGASSKDGSARTIIEPPHPIPEPLLKAIERVAIDLQLIPTWLNTGPALHWRQGLPPHLEERITWRRYGALDVGLVSRYDLVFFKLYAAADAADSSSRHVQDLLALRPGDPELDDARIWVREQDVSPSFHQVLDKVIAYVQQHRQ
jgi:hypothetical protein